VEFNEQWIDRHAEISTFLKDASHFQGGKIGWLAQRIHEEFCCTDDVTPAAIEGLALEILAECFRLKRRDSDKKPGWLLQAKDLIHAHYAEPLSLADVAKAVGIHAVRLARAFRSEYHCSVGEFIRKVRIEHACDTIRSGSEKLSDIGLELGFADQAHFIRTFKRVTGMTPGQFKATVSAKNTDQRRTGVFQSFNPAPGPRG